MCWIRGGFFCGYKYSFVNSLLRLEDGLGRLEIFTEIVLSASSNNYLHHPRKDFTLLRLFTRLTCCCLSLALFNLFNDVAKADIFGSDSNVFEIPCVTIDSPGNDPETSINPETGLLDSFGAVDYIYRIGQFEVTEGAVRAANAQSELDGSPLNITLDDRDDDNTPATSLNWFEAARFVNYLNTSSGSAPAYKFDDSGNFELHEEGDSGFNPDNRFRNSQARYFLPSVDEWYKAAYYDPVTETYFDYPTASDEQPIPIASGTAPGTSVFSGNNVLLPNPAPVTLAGGASPFGTIGQGGNVAEWEETTSNILNNLVSAPRGVRGADFFDKFPTDSLSNRRNITNPALETFLTGFRVASIASVPEPSSLLLGAMAGAVLLLRRSR